MKLQWFRHLLTLWKNLESLKVFGGEGGLCWVTAQPAPLLYLPMSAHPLSSSPVVSIHSYRIASTTSRTPPQRFEHYLFFPLFNVSLSPVCHHPIHIHIHALSASLPPPSVFLCFRNCPCHVPPCTGWTGDPPKWASCTMTVTGLNGFLVLSLLRGKMRQEEKAVMSIENRPLAPVLH